MMLMSKTLSLVLGAVLGLAAPVQEAKEFRWSKPIPEGKTLEIKGINGGIVAQAATGAAAEVVARRHGHRDDPASVEIKVVEHAGGVTICALYPASHGHPNECAPGEGGRVDSHDNDVSVEFEVRVPKGVLFRGRTVNGGIEASGLTADADVATVNGGVRIETTGAATAETVNGSVRALIGRTDWTGSLEFKTVNGSVTIEMPPSTNAEVRAETVNGSIDTDFPLTVRGKLVGRRISGTLGKGGGRLDAETVNGSIRLVQK